jgi:hypothetical protein
MFRKALAAVAIAGAALTTATPAGAATLGANSGMGGAATGSTATAVPSDSAEQSARGVVDYALRNYRCNGDIVGVGSWQKEFGKSGVVQFGTKYQLQRYQGRWVNLRGDTWSGITNRFPNDLRSFYVYFPAGASTYSYWVPTFVGRYRIVVTHKFLTTNGVWNIAKQATPACRIS